MSALIAGNLIGASLVMLLVLALRGAVARLFGANWAYALWLLPLARLLLPPLPALPAELTAIEIVVPVAATAAPAVAVARDWSSFLLALWLAGAGAFLVAQFLSYRAFLTRLSLSSASAGAYRGLPLIESEAVEGPIAVGLLDRRIVVPSDFEARYSAAERRLAAAHEYVHHRRGDIWWNLAALAVLAANWCNPIAWIAFRAFRADQELACDAAVTRAEGVEARCAYAAALVKSASRPGLIAACPMNHVDQLKRRLRMLNDHRSSRLRSLGGAAAMVVVASAGFAIGAPGIAHPHPEGGDTKQERRIVIMEHKAGEGDSARAGHGTHVMRVRRGPNGEVTVPEGCDSGQPAANVDERTGEQRTRILLCTRGEASAADRLQHLRQARERIAANTELSGEHRARVLAAIDRAIAAAGGQ